MNTQRIIYWIATAIMCMVFAFSIFNYFFNTEMIKEYFVFLGFPTWLVYPLAIAKVLGLIAVLSKVSPLLKEWAYAGFFFDAVLALAAHQIAQDGGGLFAIVAIIAIVVSRYFDGKLYPTLRGEQMH